jgi:branched-chain amino acid transport system substrate-binding protein
MALNSIDEVSIHPRGTAAPMTIRSTRSALLILAFAFSAFSVGAAEPERVELTVILPLTGALALAGQSSQRGLQVLEKHVNATGGIAGRPLAWRFLDDQSNPQVSVQLANETIARGAQVFIGGAGAAQCRATAPIVAKSGPVLYCMSPAARPDPGSYVFSTGVQPHDQIAAALRFFRDNHWNKVALLVTNDASGQEADQNFTDLMKQPENATLQLVAYEHYLPTDLNVGAQVARIKASAPQALVVWASGNATAAAFHGLHDAALDLPVVTTAAMQQYSAMDQYASILPSKLYFASSKWPAFQNMGRGPVRDQLQAYFASFKAADIVPDSGDQLAWDPAMIIVTALRKVGPNAKSAQIHQYIESLKSYAGTSGLYDFTTGDQRGLGLRDVILSLWDASRHTWVAVSDAGGRALKRNERVSGS